jgi:hypothetical protein
MTYLLFHLDYDTRQEIYVAALQHLKSTLVEITNDRDSAKEFGTARQAYEWASRNGCDWWRVGKR